MTHKRWLYALSLSLTLLAAPMLFAADKDDRCDIAAQPAATLLLPYFEVALNGSQTTIFTITNVTNQEQIARVTLWTDYSYPVVNFNIYLTGYDTQQINLFDTIVRGVIAPDLGTGTAVSPQGPYSDGNPDLDLSFCEELPGNIPQVYVNRMISAFTLGVIPGFGPFPACNTAGGAHTNAVGYATIDIVGSCGFTGPTDPGYFDDIRHTNALIGDYEQVDTAQNTSAGNEMIHLRAVLKSSNQKPALDHTFYSRYQNGGNADARQPLPSTFAANWSATPARETYFKIWREGVTGVGAACADYLQNATLATTEIVIFDEEENVVGVNDPTLPETSLTSINNPTVFPRSGGTSGWIYMNLDNGATDGRAAQNWVTVSNRGPGRATELDAAALGTGCDPEVAASEVSGGSDPIGPSGN